MSKNKDPNEKVVVWQNIKGESHGHGGKSTGHIHRDTDAGGIMFKPGSQIVMTERERDVRGSPGSNVREITMTREEAKRRFNKDPNHDND